jgi:methionine synthase II (cobalamin-independent)
LRNDNLCNNTIFSCRYYRPLPSAHSPKSTEIRKARAAFIKGELSHLDHLEAMRAEIQHVIRQQEEIELDVLVHGEAERNDMVDYFAEQLWGYAFTEMAGCKAMVRAVLNRLFSMAIFTARKP